MTPRTALKGATVLGIWFWEVFQVCCLPQASDLPVSQLSSNSPQKCVSFQFIAWWFFKRFFTFATQIHNGDLYVIQCPFRIILPDLVATIEDDMSKNLRFCSEVAHDSSQIMIIREKGARWHQEVHVYDKDNKQKKKE